MDTNRISCNIMLYNMSGKGYYRLSQCYNYINNCYNDLRIKTYLKSPMNNRYVSDFLNTANVLIMQGIYVDHLEAFPNIIKTAVENDKVVIYDTDDLDWEIAKENPVYKIFKEKKVDVYIKECLRMATVVTVTTTKLANETRQYSQSVKVIPNAIDYDYYYWNLPKKKDKWIRVGIICGSSHIHDLKLIEGIGKWVIDNFKNTKFVLGGYDSKVIQHTMGMNLLSYNDSDTNIWWHYKKLLFGKDIDWTRVEIKRTMMVEQYPALFRDVDIMLVPLIDNRFNRSKSCLRILESSARSIPIIVSDIWQYTQEINHGINGFIVRNPGDWKKYLTLLIESKELREKIGKRLREDMEPKYNIKKVSDMRIEMIKKLNDFYGRRRNLRQIEQREKTKNVKQ